MSERVSHARAPDETLCGQVQAFGRCAAPPLKPHDSFLPGWSDYQVLWSGLVIGGGSTQVGDVSGYPSSCMSPNLRAYPSASRSRYCMSPRPPYRRPIA